MDMRCRFSTRKRYKIGFINLYNYSITIVNIKYYNFCIYHKCSYYMGLYYTTVFDYIRAYTNIETLPHKLLYIKYN